MQNDTYLKPGQVAKILGMPPSTLRIYSKKFAELLSDQAGNPSIENNNLRIRLYLNEDVEILNKAKDLLARGLTYKQALIQLRNEMNIVKYSKKTFENKFEINKELIFNEYIQPIFTQFTDIIKASVDSINSWQMIAKQKESEVYQLSERIKLLEQRVALLEEGLSRVISKIENQVQITSTKSGRFLGK